MTEGEGPGRALPAAPPSARIAAYLLGGFEVVVNGQLLEHGAWKRQTAMTLFKYLLTRSHRRVRKEQAVEVLWPNADPTTGGTNLRSTVMALRAALQTKD